MSECMFVMCLSCDSQEEKMLIMNECIQLLSKGTSVTFNPLNTFTEYHKSGLTNKQTNNKNKQATKELNKQANKRKHHMLITLCLHRIATCIHMYMY